MIKLLLISLAFFTSCVFCSDSEDVSGVIIANQIADPKSLTSDLRITLDGGSFYTWMKADGSFKFSNVPLGSHILEVQSTLYHFHKIRIDIYKETPKIIASISVPGTSWEKLGPLVPYPLNLTANAKYDFFTSRESFSIWSILGNPTIIISGISLLMLLAFSKIMANMDPEALKEMQSKRPMEIPDIGDIFGKLINKDT